MTARPSSCAVCVARAPVVQRPLGPGDALVWICASCDSDLPRARLGPERGYEVPEPDAGSGRTRDRFAAAASRVAPDKSTRQPTGPGRSATSGYVLVRVPRRSGGRSLDREEARRTLSGEPWFSELRSVGTDVRYFLFERPDAEAASAARRQVDYDPTRALARLSDGGDE